MAQPTVGTGSTGATPTTSSSTVSHEGDVPAVNTEVSANGSMPNGAVGETQVAETSGNPPAPTPPSGDNVTIIHVSAGQPIDLPIDPLQLADAQIQIVGGDLEIKLPDGHIYLLVGFVAAEEAGNAPDIIVQGGEHMKAPDVLALAGTTLEDLLQTAAGGPQAGTGAANQGASFRPGEGPSIIGGLNDQGPIGPTALSYGVPEPLTGPLDKQDDNDQRALLQWHITGDTLVHEPFFGQKGNNQEFVREAISEGNEGSTAYYTVTYTGGTLAPGQSATITVSTGDGHQPQYPDATSGADYGPLNTVLTFTGGGATFQTVSVEIFSDTIVEGTEDYSVNLSGQSHGTIVDPTVDTDIVDETTGPFWNIQGDSSVAEGDNAVYTVSYNGAVLAPGQTAFITIETHSGTATEGTDFDTRDDTVLTFVGGGATAQTLTVHADTDTVVEGTEDYSVEITDPTIGVIGNPTATTDIVDQTTGPVWNIAGDSTVDEGNNALYTVSYTGATLAPGQTAFITIQTHSGTATEGSDFDSRDNTVLTFTGGGDTAQTLTVHADTDTVIEGTEDYSVEITNPTIGAIGQPTATTQIVDETTGPFWNIQGDSTVAEGNNALYTVSYNGATLAPGQTAFITIQTHSGTATEGTDFDTRDNTVLTFTGGGGTSQTLTVHADTDTVIEGTEDYSVQITNPTIGLVGNPTATTDIVDQTTGPVWNIAGDSTVDEGNNALYTVSYTGATLAPGQTAFITIQTHSGTATEGTDFDTRDNTVLTFTGGGGTSQTLTVHADTDTVIEGTEDYSVQITNPTVGTVGMPTATTQIVDETTGPVWNIAGDSSVAEGSNALYTVSYNGATLAPGQTAFITIQTHSGTATEGTDFDSRDNTVLTFTGGGGTSQTLTVHADTDTAIEGTENYSVEITNPTLGAIGQPTATTNIIDGGVALQWHITGTTQVNEGSDAIYTVSYTGATIENGQTATITVASGDQAGNQPNATADTDYTSLSTVLTFTAGQTAQTVSVHTVTDTVVEGTEDYQVHLANPSVGSFGLATVTTDIIDQTTGLTWNIAGDSSVAEGSNALYTVSYTGAILGAGQTALITIQTHSGTATEGSDFDTRDNTVLTFTGGGGTSQTLTVHADTDTVIEGTENYSVEITNPTIGAIGQPTATTNIVDQTNSLQWNIVGDSTVAEGNNALYTVSYTGATLTSGQTAFITIQTNSGTATEGTDFDTRDGTVLTFTGGGGTSQTLTVHADTDTVVEGTENYNVQITTPTIGSIGNPTATTNIADQTTGPVWNIQGDSTGAEGSNALYTVSYNGATLASGQTAFITIQTHSGTATEGTDFDSRDNTVLTFTGGGGTSQTLTVHADTDTVIEGTEDYSVQITNPTIGLVGNPTATTDIVDQTTGPTWNIQGDSTVAEGSNALYTVSYTGATLASGQTAFITIQTNSGAATEGTDFDTRDGTVLTFTGGGTTSQTLIVHADTDTVVEGTEDYNVQITNPTIGSIGGIL